MNKVVNVITFIMAFIATLCVACIGSVPNTIFVIGLIVSMSWFSLRLYCTHLYLRRQHGR